MEPSKALILTGVDASPNCNAPPRARNSSHVAGADALPSDDVPPRAENSSHVAGADALPNDNSPPRAENSTPMAGTDAHDYQIVLRAEDPTPVRGSLPLVSPVAVGMGASTRKKRRGRPRKYGPDGTDALARVLPPVPISSSSSASAPGISSVPPPFNGGSSGRKQGRGRSVRSENKARQTVGIESYAEPVLKATCVPYTIEINEGEDVTAKILSLATQGPHAITVISAVGYVSNVTLGQFDTSGTASYEGRFEIWKLMGSFLPYEGGGSKCRWSGTLSLEMACSDGRHFGGAVTGVLVAAGPVKLTVLTWLPAGQAKPKKRKTKNNPAQSTAISSSILNNLTKKYPDNEQAQLGSSSRMPDSSPSPIPTQNLASNSDADIKSSLQGE